MVNINLYTSVSCFNRFFFSSHNSHSLRSHTQYKLCREHVPIRDSEERYCINEAAPDA